MFEAYLAETISGSLLTRLDVTAGSSFTDGPLNDATSGEVTVPTETLLRMPRWWWGPFSGAVVVVQATREGRFPVGFGPILAPPTGGRKLSSLRFGGGWSLMDDRVVTARDFRPGELIPRIPAETSGDEAPEPLADTSAVVQSQVALRGLSLGSIGWRIIEYAQQRPMGGLPIVHGSPDETAALDNVDRQRTFEGWNLANNTAGKRLRELTAVINGPDMAFRPRWANTEQTRVEWAYVHGTEALPVIDQDTHPVLDLAAPRPWGVLDKATAERSDVHRVYGTGAGQEQGLLVRIHERDPEDHMPWRETVMADSDVVNPALLQRDSEARLYQGTIVQVSVKVPVDDPSLPLHAWHTGDAWEIRVPDGHPQVDKGTYQMRCISRRISFGSAFATVEFQPEEV